MYPETEYLKKIAQDDSQAFDALFMLYYPKVKNFISGLIKNEEDARDLAQDIFLKIWDNREKLDQITSFNAYLFQMAKNKVYDRYKQSVSYESYLSVHDRLQVAADDLEDKIAADDLNLLIDILIENMPDQRKKIFKLSRKEGLTNNEIALQLNISKRTVETHISKALSDIRKLISILLIFFA